MTAAPTYDLVAVGGGPAGFSAAIYAARAGLNTLVIGQAVPGGQIATTERVDNYPGLPSILGPELSERLEAHAKQAGATLTTDTVTTLEREADSGMFTLTGDNGVTRARSVVLACGAAPRQAGFEGEAAFRGRGVSYCATCDGMFFRGKRVLVVGGGNAACEEALFLANLAERVEMIIRRDRFRAPQGIVNRVLHHEKISVRYQTKISRVAGERFIGSIVYEDTSTGATTTENVPEGSVGIFVFAGTDPVVELARPFADLGPDGGVLTDAFMATRTPGLYCAGDMRSTVLRQAITAASDGAIAATAAYRYLEAQGMRS